MSVSTWQERRYGGQLQQFLGPGEQVLILATVGEPTSSSPSDFLRAAVGNPAADPRTLPWVLGFSLSRGGILWNLERHSLWFDGTSGTGAPGTIGHDLWLLLDPVGAALAERRAPWSEQRSTIRAQAPAPDLIAVTDCRLILLTSKFEDGKLEEALDLRMDVPHARIRHARRRPRGFHLLTRGRVEITFADGSMKALQLGRVRAGRARRVVDALNAATTAA